MNRWHWRRRCHKLGDTIMFMSAITAVGGGTFSVETDEVNDTWKYLESIYDLPDYEMVVEPRARRTVAHTDWTFPIIQPVEVHPRIREGEYATVQTNALGEWRSIEKPEVDIPYVDLGEVDNLPDLFSYITHAKFHIGPDSGPAWVAASVLTPFVVLQTEAGASCRRAQTNMRLLHESGVCSSIRRQ